MKKTATVAILMTLVLSFAPSAVTQDKPAIAPPTANPSPVTTSAAAPIAPAVHFKSGAKAFIEPMPNGFDAILREAVEKKKVPLMLVGKKEDADFLIRGTSESVKASTAKKVIMWNWHSNEEASIAVVSVASGEVIFAYNANKQSSAHGKRSTAESCAKHIKEELEKAK
jgi:hypothetical protein